MKSIGLSDEVYGQLLTTKHKYEQKEGRVISYDEVVKRLIITDNGKTKHQPPEDGEENQKGGKQDADMARRTAPESDTEGLDALKREPYPSASERA